MMQTGYLCRMDSRELTDNALLERWRAGDKRAGERLLQRYYGQITRFFLNKCGIGDVADLVQETFAACVEARERIRHDGKFRSYLFTVAYNVFCGHLRRRYREGGAIDFETTAIRAFTSSPSSILTARREQRLLLEGLRAIPVNYQVTLELHYWEQMSTSEISAVLDVPPGTVRTRLVRARDALEAAMSRLALSPDELRSTVTDLDSWARQCRQAMAGSSS